MAFHIHIADRDQAYWDGLPLSPEAKVRIEQHGADISDEFRLNPENRPRPDSPYFLVRHIILDRWGDGRMHSLDFHIRDDKAEFGVLLIVFIDHH